MSTNETPPNAPDAAHDARPLPREDAREGGGPRPPSPAAEGVAANEASHAVGASGEARPPVGGASGPSNGHVAPNVSAGAVSQARPSPDAASQPASHEASGGHAASHEEASHEPSGRPAASHDEASREPSGGPAALHEEASGPTDAADETRNDAAASEPRDASAGGSTSAGEGSGERKRRRRRRKRKPGAHAGAGPAGDATESGAENEARGPESPEGAAADAEQRGERDDARADSADRHEGGDRADARGKRRERKPGPPRERPPVNAGDIVFGKITEITDEAIFVDIPGKARAIFDRGEMLLPDDDDAANARPAPAAKRAAPAAAKADANEGDGPSGGEASEPARDEDIHAGGDAAAPAGDEERVSAEAGSGGAEGSAVPHAVAGEDAAARETEANEGGPAFDTAGDEPAAGLAERGHGAAAASEAATGIAEGPSGGAGGGAGEPSSVVSASESSVEAGSVEIAREPKVPRVILEVGADFIAVVHNDGARGGLVVLTHHPRRAERAKPAIEKAFNEKTPIAGLVTGVIKGGVEVDIEGVRAFAPGSHVDLRLGADLSYLVGQRLPFFVTQYAKRGRDVVLSRKSMIEEEARKARTDALARLKVGEELDGVVRSVVPFGAFVDVGGVEGLVPLQEMSHNRSDGPSDVFKAGESTRVKVMKIDDRGKVWLSRKATIPDPWQQVAQKYAAGTRHAAKIARLQPFGAFVELEPGVDGLIHTQDLSIKPIENPAELVKVGDDIEVVVAHVDPSQHKIALHPAPQGDAAREPAQRVVPHKPVKAKVVAIESGGLVVRILGVTGRNARGYVTAAGTGTPRGTELRKVFNVGQDIEAKVIEVDPRRGEVKLSIKALSEDQERNAYQQYRQQLKAEARFTFGDLLAKKSPR